MSVVINNNTDRVVYYKFYTWDGERYKWTNYRLTRNHYRVNTADLAYNEPVQETGKGSFFTPLELEAWLRDGLGETPMISFNDLKGKSVRYVLRSLLHDLDDTPALQGQHVHVFEKREGKLVLWRNGKVGN